MTCTDLHIKLCTICEIYGKPQYLPYSKDACWIRTIKRQIELSGISKESLLFFMGSGYTYYWLYNVVKFHYPEYVDILDKLMILL